MRLTTLRLRTTSQSRFIPRRGKVKYLKFKTRDEVNKSGLIAGEVIRCDGCLHEADGREVVFDVTGVVSLS